MNHRLTAAYGSAELGAKMTKNRFKWSAITAAFVAASFAGSLALAADEGQESYVQGTCNNTLGTAEPLVFDSGVAVMNGALINDFAGNLYCNYYSHSGNFYRDVDFYSFHADAGQDFDIKISNAWNGTYTWTVLGVYGPPSGGTYSLLTSDQTNKEPFIDGGFHADAAGTYYVGVSSVPGYLQDNGVLFSYDINTASPDSSSAPGAVGPYTLTVEPAAPPVLAISIEIKPGNRHMTVLDATTVAHPAALRGIARGRLPVALLSSEKDNFYPMDVKQDTLRFGATGKENSWVDCSHGRGIDFNHDGIPDLLCHFDMKKANFALSETEGYLTGQTNDGQDFAGHAWMKIVVMGLTPEKLGFGHKK